MMVSDALDPIESSEISLALAPHLCSLRRYANAIVGPVDEHVQGAVKSLILSAGSIQQKDDLKFRLFAAFHENLKAHDTTAAHDDYLVHEAQALFLTKVEGFTHEQAANLLGTSVIDIRDRAELARSRIAMGATTRVLVIAPWPEGREITDLVSALGHSVIGPFERTASVLTGRRTSKPGLVIASAYDAETALDIREVFNSPTIFITKDRSVLLASGISGKDIIERPYQRSTLAAAIAGALLGYSSSTAEESGDEEERQQSDDLKLQHADAINVSQLEQVLEPHVGPLDAEFVDGQLRLLHSVSPDAQINLVDLDGLRLDHQRDVARIIDIASNVGPSFTARFEAVYRLLCQDLSNQSALRIGNQVAALEAMRHTADEMLGSQSAEDVRAVIEALGRFSRQFPIWRQFLQQAATTTPLSVDQQNALEQVSQWLKTQPNEIVASELKAAITEVEALQIDAPGATSDLAFSRAVSNALKAIARYLVARAKGAGAEFSAALDKEIGEGLASGAITVFIAASTPLLSLALQLPAEFAWAGPLLALIRLAQKK